MTLPGNQLVNYFTAPHTWGGGFYELAVEYGSCDDLRLLNALRVIWNHPDIEGCYLDNEREPSEQRRLSIDEAMLTRADHGFENDGPVSPMLGRANIFGLARVPGGEVVPCGTVVVRVDDDVELIFYLPSGGLDRLIPGTGLPFGDACKAIYDELDPWLASIGEAVYHRVDFKFALIGHEASCDHPTELEGLSVVELEGVSVPDRRGVGILLPRAGRLTYFPSTTA